LNVPMDGASVTDRGMEFQMLGDEWHKARWPIERWHEAQSREVDYWITMSQKVGKERYFTKVCWTARRQSFVGKSSNFEVVRVLIGSQW